jgi:hypothetical protein
MGKGGGAGVSVSALCLYRAWRLDRSPKASSPSWLPELSCGREREKRDGAHPGPRRGDGAAEAAQLDQARTDHPACGGHISRCTRELIALWADSAGTLLRTDPSVSGIRIGSCSDHDLMAALAAPADITRWELAAVPGRHAVRHEGQAFGCEAAAVMSSSACEASLISCLLRSFCWLRSRSS